MKNRLYAHALWFLTALCIRRLYYISSWNVALLGVVGEQLIGLVRCPMSYFGVVIFYSCFFYLFSGVFFRLLPLPPLFPLHHGPILMAGHLSY